MNYHDDEKYMEMVPTNVRNDLSKLIQNSLSFREKWEVAKAKAEAVANKRMVIADFLIDEGLMKSIF